MQRFRNILVISPDAPQTPDVTAHAATLARRNAARLTLFDVVPRLGRRQRTVTSSSGVIDVQDLLTDTRARELTELATELDVDAEIAVGVDVPFVAAIQRVISHDHDLVVTAPDGPTGRGFRGATNALHLLRKCPVPVWVDDPGTWRHPDVAVAVGPFGEGPDVGELNTTLMELSSSLARIQGGALHVIHGWELDGEYLLRHGRMKVPSDVVDGFVQEERDHASFMFSRLVETVDLSDLVVHTHLRHDSPASTIVGVTTSVEPGVVVMGTVARTGLRGLIIGNTAERVLGEIETSIMAVKPPGFQSPIADQQP